MHLIHTNISHILRICYTHYVFLTSSHIRHAFVIHVHHTFLHTIIERWGAGVETQKIVRGEIRGWGRVPFNETYAPSLSTIYDGA